jgi:hypothetical protein
VDLSTEGADRRPDPQGNVSLQAVSLLVWDLSLLAAENGRLGSVGLGLAILDLSPLRQRNNWADRPCTSGRASRSRHRDLADAYSFCHPDSVVTPRRPKQ